MNKNVVEPLLGDLLVFGLQGLQLYTYAYASCTACITHSGPDKVVDERCPVHPVACNCEEERLHGCLNVPVSANHCTSRPAQHRVDKAQADDDRNLTDGDQVPAGFIEAVEEFLAVLHHLRNDVGKLGRYFAAW